MEWVYWFGAEQAGVKQMLWQRTKRDQALGDIEGLLN